MPTVSDKFWVGVISALALLVFLVVMGAAVFTHNETNLTLLTGVAASNATMVMGYWVGSSAGSARKDQQLIANAQEKNNAS